MKKTLEVSIFLVSLPTLCYCCDDPTHTKITFEKHLDALNRSIRRPSHDADYTTHVSLAIFGIESQTDSFILIYLHFQQYNHKPMPQIKNNKIKHNLFAFK